MIRAAPKHMAFFFQHTWDLILPSCLKKQMADYFNSKSVGRQIRAEWGTYKSTANWNEP
jgi:hypothetical protein